MSYSAHVDDFAARHLPPPHLWPDLVFDLPELQYPTQLNCAATLLDEALAEGCGDWPAILTESDSLTYGQLANRVNRLANVLTHRGVVPGNRVLLRGYNGVWLAAAWLAVMKVGAIAVTTMPMLRAKELLDIVEKAQVQFALCDHRLAADLHMVVAQTGRPGSILEWGTGTLEELMADASPHFTAVATAATDTCLLAFTSGTTGNPKATMHFHRDVLVIADVVGGHLLRTSSRDTYMGSPPLGFTFGLGALLVFPLRYRAATVLLESVTPATLLPALVRSKATCLFTAPTAYRALLPDLAQYDLRSLRMCVSAGEPLPRHTSDAWFAQTGLRIVDGLGSTEMTHIFIGAAGADVRPGATGKALPGYQACVLDEAGRPLPPGSTGRLAVKGPTGCRYLDDERQTSYVMAGWNLTGDIYRMDPEGYFWFQNRDDDLILSAGYNIAGPEVEWALQAHSAVRECAVIGSPDPDRGQIVKAFVVLNEGYLPGPDLVAVLQDLVKQRIAPYKYPRAVEFVPSLPKTPSGKLQRFELRAREFDKLNRGVPLP